MKFRVGIYLFVEILRMFCVVNPVHWPVLEICILVTETRRDSDAFGVVGKLRCSVSLEFTFREYSHTTHNLP